VPLPIRWRYKLDRWRGQLAGVFRSEPKPQRPRLCPACGTLVGASATKCHMCGASMTFSFAAASKTLARWLPQTSPVTYTILTICCVMFGLSLIITTRLQGFSAPRGGALGALMSLGGISSEVTIRLGASLPQPYDFVQPWRLVTAIFLHGSILHILFNMWVLMDIGPMVEELYGSGRYLFLFVSSGIGGYVLSSMMGRFPSVGASGGLLGLIGVLLAATTGRKSLAAQSLRSALIRWLIYLAILGFIVRTTDNYAHFGGLTIGYLLGRLMADRPPADVSERRIADLLGWTAGIVVVLSFGFMVFNYLQQAV
jgi:rhomboid protease GluP